jgi:hypothetical protein
MDPWRRLLVAAVTLALLAGLSPWLAPSRAGAVQAPGDIFISEFHYDNDGTDVGEFVEVTAPAGTDLTGWSVVRYNGATGATYTSPAASNALGGVVSDQAGGFGTQVVDYPSNGLQNGAPDGIALVDDGGNLVEFLSYEDGPFTAAGGPADGQESSDVGGAAEPSNAPLTASVSRTGDVPGAYDWEYRTLNTKGAPNPGLVINGTPLPSPVVVDCGGGLSLLQGASATRTVSASDADGTVVEISIDSIDPAPAPGDITIGATTPATEAGGTATADVSVAETTLAGTYAVTVVATNDDAEPQSGSCTLSVTVAEVLTIGQIQGQTTDEENGLTDGSPYNGETVYVRGVVTQRMRYNVTPNASNPTGVQYGFFLQSTIAAADGDDTSSDGIFVWHNRFTTLLREGSGSYFPLVGDQVVLHGGVTEFFNLTEMSNPRLVTVERTGEDAVELATEVEMTEADPADDLADANRFWERHEGMLFHLDPGAQVVAARDVFGSTADGEVWVVRDDHPLLDRTDEYTRLVYRDAHPLDPIGEDEPDGNGMRILLQSHGLKWIDNDAKALIAPARTYDSVTNELTGALYFAFGKYGIEIEQQLELEQGADPAGNAPPSAAEDGVEFASSDYNVENLYDYRDDPNDGCDFVGNAGCPGVSPPFDYVPASEEAYQAHLTDLALQIAGPMHAPDLLMIQEAEDQDICWVADDELACGSADDADGKPDTLQDLALAIAALGGPAYDTAFDRDGADDRGIISAFMYRTDTVELLPAAADDPVLGSDPGIVYQTDGLAYNADVQNPKAVNAELPASAASGADTCDVEEVDNLCVFTRDPQVGHFRVWRDGIGSSVFTELWAISNHFSSTPDRRVLQRTEQAAYNAAIAAAIQEVDPDARIVSAGDFNVFPRPDDPFYGGAESDQLGPMYDAGLHNLYDTLLADVPQSAYSYSFSGQAQTLDMQWATAAQFADLVQVRAAHINADFAADYDGDVARGASDHDPQLARWFTDVTLDRLHALVDYYVATGDLDADKAFLFHDRLDKAADYLAAGKLAAYRAQLQAFGNQAYDYATAAAAAALEREADRLAAQA